MTRIPVAALASLLLSTSASADSNWLALAEAQTHSSYYDEAFMPGSGPVRIVRVLRSYSSPMSFDRIPHARPYRSVRIQYVANCATGSIDLYAWEMYSGAKADGVRLLTDADMDQRNGITSSTSEEGAALALVCREGGRAAIALNK